VLLPRRLKRAGSCKINFERDPGRMACLRQWKLLSSTNIFNVIW
jgi:hypothetical protein